MYDVSEADRAIKHSAQCAECRAKLQMDEKLDTLIFAAMQKEGMPTSLPGRVDLNLGSMSEGTSRFRYGFYGVFSAVAALVVLFFLAFAFMPGIPSLDEMGQHVIADHTGHDDSILVVHSPTQLGQLGTIPVSYRQIAAQVPGLSFIGARICPLGDCKAIHIVFHNGQRRVSLYLINERDVDFSMSSDRRYSMSDGDLTVNFWKRGTLVYAMVG